MISKKELKLLKEGRVDYLPLPDGYQLSLDEYNQYYLGRGGKKKYALTKKFVYRLCVGAREPELTLLILKLIKDIDKIARRLKKESITRIKLDKLLLDIQNYI